MGANIILAMGALVIFGTFLSSSNHLMIGNTQVAEQNEYYITALSLAQSVIDEAKNKDFDQKTQGLDFEIPSVDSLTPPNRLGTETGEAIAGFDTLSATGYRSTKLFSDVDDYDGYKRKVNTPRAEGYKVRVTVHYASQTWPDSTMNTKPTFCKRMDVSVSSPFLPNDVGLSYAFTY